MADFPYCYTPKLAGLVLERLAAGESMLSVCEKVPGMPSRPTLTKWIVYDIDGFAAKYAQARDAGLDVMAEDLLRIADSTQEGVIETDKLTRDGTPYTEKQRRDMLEHRRLRVDTRKWFLSKLAPKRYGERLALEHSADGALTDALLEARKRTSK